MSTTNTKEKLFSEATIADVEEMLTRVFSNIAYGAVTLADLGHQQRKHWMSGNEITREDALRHAACAKIFAGQPVVPAWAEQEIAASE